MILKNRNIFFLILILLFVVLTIFSSSLPDGLEWTAEKLGFIEAEKKVFSAPADDYTISAEFNDVTNQILSAVIGLIMIISLVYLFKFFGSNSNSSKEEQHEA